MGRRCVPGSEHFVRGERTPNKKRYKVQCKHCLAVNAVEATPTFTGRRENYDAHLATCPHYIASVTPAVVEVEGAPLVAPSEWSATTIAQFESLLAAFQHRHCLPDTFIECPETLKLWEFIAPGIRIRLPRRKVLGGRILLEQAQLCQSRAESALKAVCTESGGRVNLLSDVWENVSRQHLLAAQLTLFGSVMTYCLSPVGFRHDAIVVAMELEVLLKKARDEGWVVGGVVTDDAGQCARARRILTLRWPSVVFVRCFAHDINNLVKQVLRSTFRRVALEAAAIVNAINASSSRWLVCLREVMKRKYKKWRALHTLCETRWNSMQACFASLLRVRNALTVFLFEYEGSPGFPQAVVSIIRPEFWRDLETAERVIRPLSVASYRLQRDENTLADVVISYRDIYRGFAANSQHSTGLVACIEKRWKNCEHPLFMLALYVHPVHVVAAKKLPATAVSGAARVTHFAVYYYRRLIGQDFGNLRGVMKRWLKGEYTFDSPSEYDSVSAFWAAMKDERPTCKLVELAIAVLSVAVNTATCVRMFSDLGNIHTANRNRMASEKSQHIQIIKADSRKSVQPTTASHRHPNRIISPLEMDETSDVEDDELGVDVITANDAMDTEQDVASEARGRVALPDPAKEEALLTVESWDSLLGEINMDDFEIERDDMVSVDDDDEGGLPPVNAKELIPKALDNKFPDFNDTAWPQESKLKGIRALNATLASIFTQVISPPTGVYM